MPVKRQYRLVARQSGTELHGGGAVVHTFQTAPRAHGVKGTDRPGSRRFILDFVGGELPYFVEDPKQVELVPTISGGMITSSFLYRMRSRGAFAPASTSWSNLERPKTSALIFGLETGR